MIERGVSRRQVVAERGLDDDLASVDLGRAGAVGRGPCLRHGQPTRSSSTIRAAKKATPMATATRTPMMATSTTIPTRLLTR